MRLISSALVLAILFLSGCSSHYPVNNIGPKTTHVPEEKPDQYEHPPEDLRSVVGHEGWYHYGGYYYPSRSYYNRYNRYYRYR